MLPYDHNWTQLFNSESTKIKAIFGDKIRHIYHIGSTSIPGMPAKLIIDLMLECEDLDEIALISEALKSLGYIYICRHVLPHIIFFTHKYDEYSFHLQIREIGDPLIRDHVLFRNYFS